MADALSIMPPDTTPAAVPQQPLSITPPKPFASTPLGIGFNTITGLPKAALDTGIGIARGLVSDANALGRTGLNIEGKALDKITGQNQAPAYPQSAPLPSEFHPIFGDQPVNVVPKQYQDMKTAIQNSSIAKKIGLDKVAGPLAFGGVLGQNLLDFAPLGGSEDAAIKQLAKETDPELIAGMLRKIGVHPAVADKMAPHIAATTDTGEIKNALNIMKGTQAMHNEALHNESLAPAPEAEHIPTGIKPEVNPTPEITTPTPKEPYVINAKGKDLPNLRNILEDVKSYADPATHDRIEIRNVGKTGETHTVLLDHEPVAPEVRKMDIVRTEPKTAAETVPKELQPLADEVKNYKTPQEFAAAGDGNINGIVPEWGTRNQYLSLNPAKEPNGGIGLPGERWEMQQVLKGKPAFLNGGLPSEEVKQFAAEHGLTYRQESPHTDSAREVVAKTPEAAQKVLDARNQRQLGLSLGYQDLGRTFDSKELEQFHEQVTGTDAGHAAHAEEQSKYIDQLSKEKVDGKPISKTPASSLHALASGKDGKSWESIVKGYSDNLPKEKKVNFLDYFGTPEFVLEKLGMQKGATLLQDAKDTFRLTLRKEIKTISDWKARVEHDPKARPHSAERIFRYLNGDARYAKSEMTPTEVEVAGEIKTYLKDWADRLHLPADNRLGNYITHIFDKDAHGELPGESVFDDPDLSVIMESTPAKSVYNPFLEKRTNKPGYKEDVWGALDAYVKRGSRKEAMDPALEEISNMAHKLDDSAYSYVTRLTHRINMRPTEADELVDNFFKEHFGGKFTQRPTAYITGKIRSIFYRGTLGLNVSSALRNLSQGANTYAKLGEKYTTIGYFKTLTHLVTRDWSELIDHGVLDESLNQDQKVGVYKSVLQKIDPILFSLFNTAEKINRGAAYYGAKSKGLKEGLNPDQAIKYAKRMVRETQFAFGQVDSPVALSSDLVKTAAQMQSYNVKQIEFLSHMVKNKEYGGLIRYSLSSLVFLGTVGKLFGMTVDQLIPSIGIGSSPLGSAATGIAGEFSKNSTDRQKATSQLQRTFVSLFPAGVQARKTIQGLEAYNAGKDTTPTGRTRYNIPHDPGTLMQAALFGKSALPQAQQYFDKLNNKGAAKKPTPSSTGLSI